MIKCSITVTFKGFYSSFLLVPLRLGEIEIAKDAGN